MTSWLGASHQWFMQLWFPEGAMVTPSPKRDAVRFFLVFGSLESSSGGFTLSTKTTAGFNAPAKGMRWRILAADLFSQVSAIFLRTSSLWNRRDMEQSSCMSSVWASDQRHCEGRIGGCFHTHLDKIHVSTTLLFTGHLHVSCVGYRVWRLLCAITGKIIGGMSYRHVFRPCVSPDQPSGLCPSSRTSISVRT